ncbi:MAG: hypothetical protein K2H46_05515 [Muribaculaceae bacterium]|nr:hypothetical protein [Muribaculaceae bacterium]
MENKLTRIAAFIESLPVDNNIGDCESALLSTNMTFMGGNGGNCINDMYEQCHNATNGGDCQNYNSACPKSKNKGSCLSTIVKREINRDKDCGAL